MPKAEKITVINIDEVPHAVDSLSETVKAMVAEYDERNQKLVDAQAEVRMIAASLNDLSRNIILQYKQEQAKDDQRRAAEAEAAVAVEGATEAPEAPAVNTTEAPAAE